MKTHVSEQLKRGEEIERAQAQRDRMFLERTTTRTNIHSWARRELRLRSNERYVASDRNCWPGRKDL